MSHQAAEEVRRHLVHRLVPEQEYLFSVTVTPKGCFTPRLPTYQSARNILPYPGRESRDLYVDTERERLREA